MRISATQVQEHIPKCSEADVREVLSEVLHTLVSKGYIISSASGCYEVMY